MSTPKRFMEKTNALTREKENPTQAIQVYQERTIDDLVHIADKLGELQKRVFKKDVHFGKIPGTDKDTLYKPGAELMCLLFRLTPEYSTEKIFDGDHLTVISTCALRHIESQGVWGSGEGMCSTRESKYAWRKGQRTCPACESDALRKDKNPGGGWYCWAKIGGCGAKFAEGTEAIENQSVERVPNPDLPDLYNTVLKMSNKRAYVDATIKATGASNSFTQDIGDKEKDAPTGDESHDGPYSGQGAPEEKPPTTAISKFISKAQQKRLFTIWEKESPGLPEDNLKVKIALVTGDKDGSSKSIQKGEQYNSIVKWVQEWKPDLRGREPGEDDGDEEEIAALGEEK